MARSKLILWEQTRCKTCKFFPNCPRNGDIRGTYVYEFFAEKCNVYMRKRMRGKLKRKER